MPAQTDKPFDFDTHNAIHATDRHHGRVGGQEPVWFVTICFGLYALAAMMLVWLLWRYLRPYIS